MYKILKLLLLVLLTGNAWAQMPHEVLVLVNKRSQASLRVANTYVATRNIPRQNLIYLDIPEEIYGGSATLSPEQFTQLIWDPTNAAAKKQGVDAQVLAWVYSVDFPIRVKTDASDRKQMSVSGLTFMRNQIPDLTLVEEGNYFSKLFAGPNGRLKLNLNSMSLGMKKRGLGAEGKVPDEAAWLADGLGDEMPLPSMMLGYIGEKGTDVQAVLDCIKRGAASDFRGQRKGIYFVKSGDVRSTCREWQFEPVVEELAKRNITANVVTNFPAKVKQVMGVMMGAETVDPSTIESFAPGAMAEHLTSWSAEFQKRQTKMTEWIKAGATASAGVVVEPYSNPNKFPGARFFTHYASGCTVLESFYQSIACPLQNLLLGDPLARPYAAPFKLNILGADTMKSDFTYLAQAKIPNAQVKISYSFFVDGKEIRGMSEDNSVYLRLLNMTDGWHELRCVARVQHLAEYNMVATKSIIVDRSGRSVTIQQRISRISDHEHGIKVLLAGARKPVKLQLVSGERVIEEKDYSEDVELILNEKILGEGPNQIRAVAVYSNGEKVSSVPMNLGVKFSKK